MESEILFKPYTLGPIQLLNRMVMAPLTRCRAIGNIPNELMAHYYEQRAGAGLIIAEGTSPSPNGLGYARIPGLFSQEQLEGWKKVTFAVHRGGSELFIQLMHTGRISHTLNLPEGATVVAPSAVLPAGQIWTDQQGLQGYSTPKAMTLEDIETTKEEYVKAAQNAISAGVEGVELHAANGYLLEQFLSPHTNIRIDRYGGSIQNRCRFVLEVVEAVAKAIGKEKVGIRFSPFGVAGDMKAYPEQESTYEYLAEQLALLDIVYIHILDHSSTGAPAVPTEMLTSFRALFPNTIILCGGFNRIKAEEALQDGRANLIAFGRPYISNPDLMVRYKNNWPQASSQNEETYYTSTEQGYTDYEPYNTIPSPLLEL